MNKNPSEYPVFASVKYEGALVTDGFLDARKAADALSGIDEALRFFLYYEDPALHRVDFAIPVKTRQGSWEIIFQENIDALLLKTAIASQGGRYFDADLEQLPADELQELGFKAIFRNAFKSMTWVLKMAKHLGYLTNGKIESIEFIGDNKVSLENKEGKTLHVPAQYLKLFASCPPDLFRKLALIIETERELVVSYTDSQDANYVRIGNDQKYIFIPHEDENHVLFPELHHNSLVALEGHISRGNESSNTLGFVYQQHVLTCYPQEGNIKTYKGALFTNAIVKGFVDRLDKKTGEFIEKRPRIRFVEIISNDPADKQLKLF